MPFSLLAGDSLVGVRLSIVHECGRNFAVGLIMRMRRGEVTEEVGMELIIVGSMKAHSLRPRGQSNCILSTQLVLAEQG